MLPKHRVTTHPGEILLEEFLLPMQITQSGLARHVGVHPFVINELVHGKRGISTRMAMMLAQALGTTPEFWMGLQSDFEMSTLMQSSEGERVRSIPPLVRAS